MSVYMLIDVEVTDSDRYSEYVKRVPRIIARHGGRYLVRGGPVTSLSGNWNPTRIIIIEFETAEQMQECFSSPEYLELAPLREEATLSRAVLVEGYTAVVRFRPLVTPLTPNPRFADNPRRERARDQRQRLWCKP